MNVRERERERGGRKKVNWKRNQNLWLFLKLHHVKNETSWKRKSLNGQRMNRSRLMLQRQGEANSLGRYIHCKVTRLVKGGGRCNHFEV